MYANLNNTFESGLQNAKSVVSLDWLYDGLKQFFGKAFSFVLVGVLALPFVFLFGFWLQRKRRMFVKEMKREKLEFSNVKNYLRLKNGLRTLVQFQKPLEKVSKINAKEVPVLFRYTVVQMKKMSSTLLTFTDWLNTRFDNLNSEQFKSETNLFKFLPERDLWNNRNQAYHYWM